MPAPPEDLTPPAGADEPSAPAPQRSLFDDFEALFSDARTYFDAEVSYQKSRAGFVANRFKKAAVFGVVAAFVGVIALIGLTVGLIIALTPLITAWGATAVVVLSLLLFAFVMVRRAGNAWNEMTSAMHSSEDEPAGEPNSNV
ncbi:phage holin family protein [Erythrobacter alti]|uniref:phage holin family protein n=1 Tax=Erythrobacter alti TaxID=1896145 RepID=UPI0030F43655